MDVLSRLRRASPRITDVLVAAAVAVPTVMDAWWNEPGTRQADAVTYVLAVTSVVALLARRRWPVPVAVVCGAALSGLYAAGHRGELLHLPAMVALYTVAVRSDRRTTVITAVVAPAWSGILAFVSGQAFGAPDGWPVIELIWPLVPMALGEAVRSRRQLAEHTAAERERDAQRRAEAERLRMVREFHDVVAHTMVAVNVQMAAAVAAFDADPEVARRTLHEARAASKAALQELRATVALNRGAEPAGPAPTLARVRELAEPARAAGIDVAFEDERGDVELSGAGELAAYRVVQEAITNVVRHTDARHVAVSLRRSPEGLVVEVADAGTTGPSSNGDGRGGFGLTGMVERTHALGGRLEHGPAPSGGYRVRAVLPARFGPR